MKHGRWQTELPDSEGDWLWIWQWSCGCCLLKNGIVWATTEEKTPETQDSDIFRYTTPAGIKMALIFSNNHPGLVDGELDIHWWQKIELPPSVDDVNDGIKQTDGGRSSIG